LAQIEEIASRSATEIGLAFRNGEADPVVVTECLLERIERARGDNTFITVTAERARREAEDARVRYREGRPLSALDGVPIAWKDLIDVAGAPTTGGSLLFKETPPKTADHTCVANAARAGMVSIGKLNLTEFAYSGLGLNPHFGTPVNPNDRSTHRAPGGSSSGAGTAVAARLVTCAVGSDTGGSVRLPAAFNGVTGFKTSEGRIDKTGMLALSRTLDTIGPLARTVADCVHLDMILRGAVSTGVRRQELAGVQFVAPTNVVLAECESAVLDNFERVLEEFERAGAKVERRKLAALDRLVEMTAAHGTLTSAEAYCEFRDIVESEQGRAVDRRVVHRIMQGKSMSAHDLLCIQSGREAAIAELQRDVGDAFLALPTTAITAPEVAPLEADEKLFHDVNLRALRNTTMGNLLRECCLALPSGRDAAGLPTSIMISARHGQDERLLGIGLEVERLVNRFFEPLPAVMRSDRAMELKK